MVGSDEAAYDSGSVAVAIARRWAAHGREVLLVDADATGAALARRLGDANRSTFSPAERGLPSLIAAHQPLTAGLLREHCWRLGAAGTGDVWLLLGPTNASGAHLAAGWTARNAEGLVDANADRSMVVAVTRPLMRGEQAFIQAASVVVVIARADTESSFEALCALGDLLDGATDHRSACLVIDGPAVRSYEEIRSASGVHVAGRLDDIPERVLLSNRPRRRDSKPARLVEELAARIAFLAADEERDEPDREASENQPGDAGPNGREIRGTIPPASADGPSTSDLSTPRGNPNSSTPVKADR